MRHTFYIFAGKELASMEHDFLEVVMADPKAYIQHLHTKVISDTNDEELDKTISQWVDENYNIETSTDQFVTITIVTPLWQKCAFLITERVVSACTKLRCHYNLDVIALSKELKHIVPQTDSDIEEISFDGWRKLQLHRFIVISNHNNDGIALNLEKGKNLAKVIAIYASLCIDDYDSIYPLSENQTKVEVMGLGLSVCYFDKQEFVEKLLHKSYIELMRREDIHKDEVDTNKSAVIVASNFDSVDTIVSDFFGKEVSPLVDGKREDDQVLVEVTPKVGERIDALNSKLSSVIDDNKYSLPEKEAMQAMTLGYDDELLTNYLYDDTQKKIFDDCYNEAIDIYLQENNQLPGRECDSEGNVIKNSERVLDDVDTEITNPLKQIKETHADILRDTNYVRMKRKELEDLRGSVVQDEVDRLIKEMREDCGEEDPAAVSDEAKEAKFSSMNANERYAAITVYLEQKCRLLEAKQEHYRRLRQKYESLLQQLCDESKRREIAKRSKNEQKGFVEKLKQALVSYKHEKEREIDEAIRSRNKITFWLSLITLVLFVIIGYSLYDDIECMQSTWFSILAAVFVIFLFITICVIVTNKQAIADLRAKYNNGIQEREAKIRAKKRQLAEHNLRLHVAGMFIDQLYKVRTNLASKYKSTKSFVDDLKGWYASETETVEGFAQQPVTGIFKPVIKDDILTEFFERNKDRLLNGAHLHQFVGQDRTAANSYQDELRDIITKNVNKLSADFIMYRYLLGEANYSFLPPPSQTLQQLLSQMERSSCEFLQIRDTFQTTDMAATFLSLFTSKQEETDRWRREFRQYFNTIPATIASLNPYRLVVLRRRYARFDDLIL